MRNAIGFGLLLACLSAGSLTAHPVQAQQDGAATAKPSPSRTAADPGQAVAKPTREQRASRRAKRDERERKRQAEVAKLKDAKGCSAAAAVERAQSVGLDRARIVRVRRKAIIVSGRVSAKTDLKQIRFGKKARLDKDGRPKRARVVISRNSGCDVRAPRTSR